MCPCIVSIIVLILITTNKMQLFFIYLFISKCSTCFRRFIRPSPGAHNCTHSFRYCQQYWLSLYHHHHHKHQGLDPLIRSVSRITAARANASSVFQLFSFLVVCSGMISRGFGFVTFFASVKASPVCIHLSCLVCL